jgi:hypothetical protein
VAVMADLHALGPIGFRGPGRGWVPEHLTSNGTVQLISPGDRCPSNALVGDVLDLIGEDILYITSANTSSHVSKQVEAAHYEMREIQREFGRRDDVVLIGHRNERANRRQYPHHLPCSTSIVAFDEGELALERLGSLGADVIAPRDPPRERSATGSERCPRSAPAARGGAGTTPLSSRRRGRAGGGSGAAVCAPAGAGA